MPELPRHSASIPVGPLDTGHVTVRNSASSPGMAHGTRSPRADAVPHGGVPGADGRIRPSTKGAWR